MFESLSRNQEVIIIRKLLSIFLVLVVITSFSVTAFAAGEQPSGSTYDYITTSGTKSSSTFWTAVSTGLYNLSTWFAPLRLTSYQYYNGTSNAGTGNFYTALSNSLYNLGSTLRTRTESIISDTSTIASRISTTNTYLNTIATEKLPVLAGYSYDNNSGTVTNTNFWSATTNQLQFIFRKLDTISSDTDSIDSKLDNIGPSGTNYPKYASGSVSYSDFWDALSNSASSIAYYNNSINNKLPGTGYYAYVDRNGTYVSQADSTRPYWSCLVFDLAYIGEDIQTIANRLPSGSTYSGVNGDGSRFQSNYYTAVTDSFRNVGYDVEQLKNFVSDLHYMFASPEDIALKQDQENNISSATTNFLSGSDSATSVGTGSIGKVKDLGDDVSSFFDTGVQATSLFDSLSDTSSDGPWLWFSSAVRDNLTGSQSRSNSKSSNLPGEQVVDFYSDKMATLNKLLGEVSEND